MASHKLYPGINSFSSSLAIFMLIIQRLRSNIATEVIRMNKGGR